MEMRKKIGNNSMKIFNLMILVSLFSFFFSLSYANDTVIACMGESESSCDAGYDIFVPARNGRGVDDAVIARNYCATCSEVDNRFSGKTYPL